MRKVVLIYAVGVVVFLGSGALIVFSVYNATNNSLKYATEVMNILPDAGSALFLFNALYRLRRLAHGTMHIETKQLLLHAWSFVTVCIAGVLLSFSTLHTWRHATWFYTTYFAIIVMVFVCELPF